MYYTAPAALDAEATGRRPVGGSRSGAFGIKNAIAVRPVHVCDLCAAVLTDAVDHRLVWSVTPRHVVYLVICFL